MKQSAGEVRTLGGVYLSGRCFARRRTASSSTPSSPSPGSSMSDSRQPALAAPAASHRHSDQDVAATRRSAVPACGTGGGLNERPVSRFTSCLTTQNYFWPLRSSLIAIAMSE
jgi:hypothetical protein